MATAAPATALRELTLRGIVLGAILTVLFTAANVYLGLKLGITFATSIPAAVISMAVLRYFANSTIQENNIVQTIASAAGTLSAIIFVLPGLIMVGWWTGFPFWLSVAVIALGGILGVMYSVPLRRALVIDRRRIAGLDRNFRGAAVRHGDMGADAFERCAAARPRLRRQGAQGAEQIDPVG